MLKKLRNLLSSQDKKFIAFLIAFSIVISIIETIGISAIMPFLTVATNFDFIHDNKYFSWVYNFLGFSSEINFIIMLGIILIIFYFVRSFINILYNYFLARFTQSRYHIFSMRLFRNYMGMSYRSFLDQTSAHLTRSIVNEASLVATLLTSLLILITEFFVIFFIYMMLLVVNYKITLLLTFFLLINGLLVTKTVSRKIKSIGKERAIVQKKFYDVINKSFGNFKLIKLNSVDGEIIGHFHDYSYKFSKIAILNSTLQVLPRFFLEAIGFSIIIAIVTFLIWKYETDIQSSLGMITMFVLALYRLMPSVNRIISSYNTMQYNSKALDIVYSELTYPVEKLGDEKVTFSKNIELQNISFSYDNKKTILHDINLNIPQGSKIAFVGESGSGKSTLVDLIMGLYKPKSGSIIIDDMAIDDTNIKNWRSHIGYIPQTVYLFDGTVAENVAFDREIDEAKIIECLKKANIYDFLEQKEGLNTIVGEGGIMLSGGQKQRIAIARALYTDPDTLVLDEATSALDNDTERKIMDEIYDVSQNKTLIIIAHRLSTIEKCDKIYTIKNGKLSDEL